MINLMRNEIIYFRVCSTIGIRTCYKVLWCNFWHLYYCPFDLFLQHLLCCFLAFIWSFLLWQSSPVPYCTKV